MKGRPKIDNPKGRRYEIRMSDDEIKLLENLSSRSGKSKSDIVRRALELYNRMSTTESKYREF